MRKKIWLILAIILVLLLLAVGVWRVAHYLRQRFASPADAGKDEIARLEADLKSDDWHVRQAAAFQLSEHPDVSPERRAQVLVDELSHEISSPADSPPAHGAYLPRTDTNRLQATRMLGGQGADAQAVLRKTVDGASGEVRERAVLALGYAGDRSVIPEVRRILLEAKNPTVRMDAAHLLGELQDQAAKADLEKALDDPYFVEEEYPGDQMLRIYPVRDQAVGALAALGVQTQRRSSFIHPKSKK